MAASSASIALKAKGNLTDVGDFRAVGSHPGAPAPWTSPGAGQPFLRVPPFAGARSGRFTEPGSSDLQTAELVEQLRRLRVGGTYWGGQPKLPSGHVLVRSAAAVRFAKRLWPEKPLVLWPEGPEEVELPHSVSLVGSECDPWHMLSSAVAVVIEARDEVGLVAAVLGVACHVFDPSNGRLEIGEGDAGQLLGRALGGTRFNNPFTGESMTAREAIELCGFWRRLIDSNRDIGGGLGFAFWKQNHVAPLLWDGSGEFPFLRNAKNVRSGRSIAIWRSKTATETITTLYRRKIPLVEVEDGFLRSRGLGADCIPPLSITVDRLGPHFDPSRPSELELLLEEGRFDDALLGRARKVRRLIVEAGIGKYECADVVLDRPAGTRRHVLVPGQVEDDRAVVAGGCGLVSNLELLARVREQAPDAYILYKPHPDVLAGHRRGAIDESDCLRFVDEVVGGLPIASLIEMVDEVHVNTSLAGFEALLRGKRVVTHGVPFYAGWGLTHDLGPVPPRRTARRTIDELVAATLLLYPRYLDPVTRLPCPAEIVVARLRDHDEHNSGMLVGMRRLQGRFMRRLRSLVQ